MCGVIGITNFNKKRFSGDVIARALDHMRERGNGLGSGYAGYGIYPDNPDDWCLHIFFNSENSRLKTEDYFDQNYGVAKKEPIPTKFIEKITNPPLIWRYFLKSCEKSEDAIFSSVMKINTEIPGAFVVSSGKNMGVFKGVGFPHEISEFYDIKRYKAYTWIAHNRFPTNTPGWWGGAHPFGLLDFSLVHNGEISSYGINKRYLESYGYKLTLQTDSEAILYLWDLLLKRHKLPIPLAAAAMAPTHWEEIDDMNKKDKELFTAIRMTYASCLINGPSALILGFEGGMLGLNDRIKLRPLVAARSRNYGYISSEESGITAVSEEKLDEVFHPAAGEPIVFRLKK